MANNANLEKPESPNTPQIRADNGGFLEAEVVDVDDAKATREEPEDNQRRLAEIHAKQASLVPRISDWILHHDPSRERYPGLPTLSEAEARYLREYALDPGQHRAVLVKRARTSYAVAQAPRVLLWQAAMRDETSADVQVYAGAEVGRLRSLVLARLAREAIEAEDARVAALAAKVFLDNTRRAEQDSDKARLLQLSDDALKARLRQLLAEGGDPE